MYQNQKPTTSKQKTKGGFNNHANFIEALKSAGSSMVADTAKSFKDDLIIGSAKQIGQSILGSGPSEQAQNQSPENDFNFAEFMRSSEAKTRAQSRVAYEYEQQETVIFNRRQEETNNKIESIRMEIKALAREVAHLDQSTETAISQEIIDPGTYHLHFFDKLLVFIRRLRKSVAESRNWAAMHQQRGKAKSYFWQQANSKIGGTKFLLSQERQVATQTG